MNRCSFWFGKDVVLFNSTKSTQCKSIHLFIAYFHTYFFGKLPCGFTLINRLGKILNITTVLLSLLRCWKTYKAEVVAVIIFVNKTVKSVIYFCKKMFSIQEMTKKGFFKYIIRQWRLSKSPCAIFVYCKNFSRHWIQFLSWQNSFITECLLHHFVVKRVFIKELDTLLRSLRSYCICFI
jgi:hypothetical protein